MKMMNIIDLGVADHPFPANCGGEECSCGKPAAHKVGEESAPLGIHNLTAYVCCGCFKRLFGGAHDIYPYDLELDDTGMFGE